MKKIVLTGAAGRLGTILRQPLLACADTLLSTDIVPDIGALKPRETYVSADLADFDAIDSLLHGADMVVHFGGRSTEAPFDQIVGPNLIGAYNIWHAAQQNGLRRVIYASSIHAVGMHLKSDFIGAYAAHRPDTFYGLSKCFAEDMARLYWDKHGLETVCVRILSCADVTNARALGSWLSDDDLVHLVTRAISTQTTGFSIIYGVSNNDRVPVDNASVRFLGYRPKDNAEAFAPEILAQSPPVDPRDAAHSRHGGPYSSALLGSKGIAMTKVATPSKES